MSEAYSKTKQLLNQLVYPPALSTSANEVPAPGQGQQQGGLIPIQQQALFSRLQSYTVTTWFGKPSGLTPLECASKGWRNTGPDMLTCDACGSKVWVKLPTNPLAESAAGIVKRFVEQLTAGHDAVCLHRSSSLHQAPDEAAVTTLCFPIIPSSKLASSYHNRLQDMQHLDLTPVIQTAAVAKLAAMAIQQLQDSSLLKALATLLHVPADLLQQAASTQGLQQAMPPVLSKHQTAVMLALCGWQVHQLLSPDLAAKSAVATQANSFAVSHLVPQRRHSAGASSTAGPSTGSKVVSSAHTALGCELCGSRIGLWRFTHAGPYFVAQLASKAAAVVKSAESSLLELMQHTEAQTAAAAAASSATPAKAQPAQSTAERAAAVTSIAGGLVTLKSARPTDLEPYQQQEQDDLQHSAAAAASGGAVTSSLHHTIAGGSLLALPASSPFGQASASGGGSASGFGRQGSGSLISPKRPGPFGSPAAPVFGSAAAASAPSRPHMGPHGQLVGASVGAEAGGGSLFGLAGSASPASVFDSAGQHALFATGTGAGNAASQAPVFGIGAMAEQEQRIKRRRSSTGAAVAAAVIGGSSAGSLPTSPAPRAPSASKQAKREAAAVAGEAADQTGSTALAGSVPTSWQPNLQAGAGASSSDCFDPIDQHKPWCPWVHKLHAQNAAARKGVVPALSLGWSSTLLALLEQMEEDQLKRDKQQTEAAAALGQLGDMPQPGQFDTTAAVLQKARQVLDALD